eukprot:12796719-Alexandrium_andersonii.AAC.1
MVQQLLDEGRDMLGLRETGIQSTDWVRLLAGLLCHNEEYVADILASSRKMTMAIVHQSMARVKDDIVAPQRRPTPTTRGTPVHGTVR